MPLFISALRISQQFPLWGLGRMAGFACTRYAGLQSFWLLALVQQAPLAIILAAMRRFRSAVLFRGPRPSPRPGAPSWPSGLTLRSSRPAYGGRLILAVSCS
jgi:hypothetical protein